jgi:hypothetical protein
MPSVVVVVPVRDRASMVVEAITSMVAPEPAEHPRLRVQDTKGAST